MCRSIEGTDIVFFIRETPEGYKVSMRCRAEYDVADICTRFNGGGHKAAAGCTLNLSCTEAINTLLEAIGEVL